jgi:DNA-binding transcriptional regulator PaaX
MGKKGRKFGSELGWAIIEAVANGIDLFEYACQIPSAPLGYYDPAMYKSYKIERERHRILTAANRLKKQKLLRVIQNDRGRAFKLTSLGRKYLAEHKSELPPVLPSGMKTIVSFDIPEKHRVARQAFRVYLKSIGFAKLHRSVWISNLDWAKCLKRNLDKLKIGDWVHIFQGQGIADS